MKYIEKTLMSIVLVGLLGGCGETGVVELNSDKVSRSINLTSVSTIQDEGVSYLNSLRADAGMIPFQREYHLEDAAQNHANYLIINNTFSHYESQNASGFTGVAPANRAQFEAYAYAGVGENISSSNASVEKSIDTLFSAIYHRFGFLNFDYDEIGVGFAQSDAYRYGNVYNYNMGMSPLRILCEGAGEVREGEYYANICTDSSKMISLTDYTHAENQNKYQNPDFVIWPANGSDTIPPVFYEELPDPMPECSVSGYPTSISFNPLKSSSIMIDSFKLFDSNNQEIKDVKLMDENTDPNHTFTAYEFALFPQQRLDWDSAYRVEIAYHDSQGRHQEVVNFKTASLPHPSFKVSKSGESFEVPLNQTRIFYLPPAHCNDTLSSFSATGLLSEIAFYDANTIMITPKSRGRLEVKTSNGRKFTLNVR